MKIAFIGVGAMGSLMSQRLAAVPGVELSLYDRDEARLAAVADLGRAASSIADAARDADAIFSVVPADRHTKEVVAELAEVGREGQYYVDFSTIGPDTIEAVEEQLGARGVVTISAGMTQSIEGATNGTLKLFLGGPAELPESLLPAFDALTEEVRMVGGVGMAKALKLINNMVNACLDVAICEALVLGERCGISHEAMAKALEEQGADSWPLQHHIIKHVLPDDLGPGFFSTRLLVKDMTLCMEFVERLGLPAIFVGLGTCYYRGSLAEGHSEDYHMIVIRWLERAANFAAPGQPPTGGRDELPAAPAIVAAIVAGVVAIQTLLSTEALEILGRVGIGPVESAEHLVAGSAGNDSLRALIEGEARATPGSLAADLGAAIALSRQVQVPSVSFEVARHTALRLGERYGADRDVWEVASA